eukprot:3807336-Rhodomonas_salina.1
MAVGVRAHRARLRVVIRRLDVEVSEILGRILADTQVAHGYARLEAAGFARQCRIRACVRVWSTGMRDSMRGDARRYAARSPLKTGKKPPCWYKLCWKRGCVRVVSG